MGKNGADVIQEPYPPWPKPGGMRVMDMNTPFDASPDDVLRRMYHLSNRRIWTVIRDWWRGWADCDLMSYDAKIKAMTYTAPKTLTDAEMRAHTARRERWLKL